MLLTRSAAAGSFIRSKNSAKERGAVCSAKRVSSAITLLKESNPVQVRILTTAFLVFASQSYLAISQAFTEAASPEDKDSMLYKMIPVARAHDP